ncbi:MAG: motility associated factor glycosyltransferase family protein [Epulopiscium sp.]|nr:motility associated factor glycosyltransferase family protein [Candidatus Epulonipiscium sp.]
MMGKDWNQISNIKIDQDKYIVEEAKDGNLTLKVQNGNQNFYLHSSYKPLAQGETFARQHYEEGIDFVVYGLGLGYHIQALANLLQEKQKLYIFELDMVVVKIALEQESLRQCLQNPQVILLVDENLENASKVFAEYLSKENIKFILYEPSLKHIPYEPFKEILESYRIWKNSHEKFSPMLEENHKANIVKGYGNIGKKLKNQCKDIPCIVVSAGPSLKQNVKALKEYEEKAIIIAVGRTADFLLSNGVRPHFFIESDPQKFVYNHLKSVEENVPLILLSTASQLLDQYPYDKYILYEEGSATEEEKPYSIQVGGSVATMGVSLALLMGCNPIIFIGQDLCYTGGQTHVNGRRVQDITSFQEFVRGISGEMYPTNKGLKTFLRWFEKTIQQNPEIEFINCTAEGAYIQGATHCTLEELGNQLQKKPIIKIIEKALICRYT